ncbi:MAG: hypothetical protein GQ570_03360 [Helicobacteraceae bacterium]|nr:hypothetical protein [Helicobacteraceae bacterium]
MNNEMYDFFNFESWEELHNRFISELEIAENVSLICIKYIFSISHQTTYSNIRTRLTGFRNKVKSSDLNEDLKKETLLLFTLPKNIADALNDKYATQQREKLKAINELPKLNRAKYIRDMKLLGTMIEDNAKEDILYYRNLLQMYLEMSTGRRDIELYKLGKFRKVKNNNSRIYFAGQAKGKNLQKKEYIIPILNEDSDFILFCICELRATVKNNFLKMSNIKLMEHIRGANAKQDFYTEIQKKLKLKNLNGNRMIRSAYAVVAENIYNDKMEYRTYISSILGHLETDVHTMESYIKHFIPKRKRS